MSGAGLRKPIAAMRRRARGKVLTPLEYQSAALDSRGAGFKAHLRRQSPLGASCGSFSIQPFTNAGRNRILCTKSKEPMAHRFAKFSEQIGKRGNR
jgi:hypothetical protein